MVEVNEAYPAGFSFFSSTPIPDTGTNNKWTFHRIEGNTTQTIIIKGSAPASPGSLTNTAEVTSSTDDQNLDNNTISQNIKVIVPMGVGGEVIEVNKLIILAPWLVLIVALILCGSFVVLIRRTVK
jgi:hypothetical protein